MEEEYDLNNPYEIKMLFNSHEFDEAVYDYMEGKNIAILSMNYGISKREIKVAMFVIWALKKLTHPYIGDIQFEMIEALKKVGLM